MPQCSRCGAQSQAVGNFCAVCGQPNVVQAAMQYSGRNSFPNPHPTGHAHLGIAARGFGQVFGLDPRITLLTVVVDAMLFGGEGVGVLTGGVLLGPALAMSVIVGVAVGFVTYKAQMRWYGDDRDSALIKGIILGILTAIPTAIPAFLYVPSGVLGMFHMLRRKKT